jgi:hypothetical protein
MSGLIQKPGISSVLAWTVHIEIEDGAAIAQKGA